MSVLELLTKQKSKLEKQRIAADRAVQSRQDAVRKAIAESVNGQPHDENLIVEFFEHSSDPVGEYERACEAFRACETHAHATSRITELEAEKSDAWSRKRDLSASIRPVTRHEGNLTKTDNPPLVATKLAAERAASESDELERHLEAADAANNVRKVHIQIDWLGREITRLEGQIAQHQRIQAESNARFDDSSQLESPLNFQLPHTEANQ